jgi:hypothetical protein
MMTTKTETDSDYLFSADEEKKILANETLKPILDSIELREGLRYFTFWRCDFSSAIASKILFSLHLKWMRLPSLSLFSPSHGECIQLHLSSVVLVSVDLHQ